MNAPDGEATPATKASRSWSRWLLAAMLVLGVILFYATGLHERLSWNAVRGQLDDWLRLVDENLVLALLVYVSVYTAVTALSLPAASLLTLVGGALFGRWLGTAAVSFASTLGATLAFLSSRYLFRDLVQRRFTQKLESFDRGVETDGAYYLLVLRLVPLFPFFLVNLGMGLTSIRTWTYVWVSWLGMLPATFLYVNAGTELATIDSLKGIVSPSVLLSLALLGIVPLVIRKVIQRSRSKGNSIT
jgi:uncharacterized membrane protein YdjX (TVP38/TMEM64 family)